MFGGFNGHKTVICVILKSYFIVPGNEMARVRCCVCKEKCEDVSKASIHTRALHKDSHFSILHRYNSATYQSLHFHVLTDDIPVDGQITIENGKLIIRGCFVLPYLQYTGKFLSHVTPNSTTNDYLEIRMSLS